MKKRSRVLSVLLCAAMMVSLAACGSDKKESSDAAEGEGEKIKLTFSTSVYVEEPHQKAIDNLLAAYNEKNPNVEIEVLGAGYDGYWDNITNEIVSGTASDMIQVYPENISTYHALKEGGTFVNLDEYMSDELKEKLTGQEMCVVDGETLAISSYAWGTTGIFYRKSMLEEKGIDPESIKTLDDFREACLKFTEDGGYATGVVSGTHGFTISEWNRLVARPVSGGLYFPNGESGPYTAENVNVNCDANVWAAQWWQDFILKDKAAKLVTDKSETREMFWNGEIPFCMDGPWFVGMTSDDVLEDVGIIAQPDIVYNGETYKPNPTNYPLVTMINKDCEHPEEAYAFLEWMTSDEAQAIIAECGMIPSNTDYSTSDEYIENHALEYAIVDFMQNNYTDLVADPNIPQLGEISQIMLDAGQKMFSEQAADVKTEMDAAQKKIEEVMSK